MKANELKVADLMVGDWVICYHPSRLKSFEKVSVGLLHTMQEQEYGHIKEDSPLFRIVEPIPLTPEILEKNDILYEKQSYYYVIEDDKDLECTYYIQQVLQGDWVLGVDIGAYDCSVFARVKYVHQLQHALRLCGINKEIEL